METEHGLLMMRFDRIYSAGVQSGDCCRNGLRHLLLEKVLVGAAERFLMCNFVMVILL